MAVRQSLDDWIVYYRVEPAKGVTGAQKSLIHVKDSTRRNHKRY